MLRRNMIWRGMKKSFPLLIAAALFAGMVPASAFAVTSEGSGTGETEVVSEEVEEPKKEEAKQVAGGARALTEEELADLSDSLDQGDKGFFSTEYSRAEEIRWDDVLGDGADIGVIPDAVQREAYEDWSGSEGEELVGVYEQDVRDFVLRKTGTDYSDARYPLSLDWLAVSDDRSGDQLFIAKRGEADRQAIAFTAGTADGDLYRLRYVRADKANHRKEREFEVTVRIDRDGNRAYVSNLPTDVPAPKTLVTIDFFASRTEAMQQGPVTTLAARPMDSDEAADWYWALITAAEDDVEISVDRAYVDSGIASLLSSEGIRIPDLGLGKAVLMEGESAMLRVSLPQEPRIRVAATKDGYFGEYWFGEDSRLKLVDEEGVPKQRYVIGHDLEGEGRGCSYGDEAGLTSFLEGGWVMFDEATGEPTGGVVFSDHRTMWIITEESDYQVDLQYDTMYGKVPDVLKTEVFEPDTWSALPEELFTEHTATGAYLIGAEQQGNEQVLTLTQIDNGFGALSYLMPGADEDTQEFILHRYIGSAN